ncbi:hypothetical protein XENORESO_001379, partial [Xenotaenia resolanae]
TTPALQSSTASTTSALRTHRRKHASSAPVIEDLGDPLLQLLRVFWTPQVLLMPLRITQATPQCLLQVPLKVGATLKLLVPLRVSQRFQFLRPQSSHLHCCRFLISHLHHHDLL